MISITDIIGHDVDLSPGLERHTGPCPFCQGLGTFSVNADEQTFSCTGCEVGGDVLTYLMRRNGWTLRWALKHLMDVADAANVRGK